MVKKLLLALVLVGMVIVICAWYLYKTSKESSSLNTKPFSFDLSSKIVFIPEREYSIKKYRIKDRPEQDFIIPGLFIDSMLFRIPVKFVDDRGPLWNADCNDRALLEKKTIMGWQVLEKDNCLDKNSAGSFIHTGNQSEEEVFSFNLLLGRVDGPKVIPVDLTGTYRVWWDLAYDCQSELIGEKGSGNVRYFNCKRAVSYSPEFKIIP